MENQNLLLKLSKLFPSSLISCQSKTLPVVADSSILVPKPKKIPHENDPCFEPYSQKDRKEEDNCSKAPGKPCCRSKSHYSNSEGRKCSPVIPASAAVQQPPDNQTGKNQSSSSNSCRWFTSSDELRTRAAADGFETDTFFSLSSNSGESLRHRQLATRKCEEMKSIDENGRHSFSSLPSSGGGKGSGTESGAGPDLVATRLYYESGGRRRRNRRRMRCFSSGKEFSGGSVMDEGFAVEKSSSDPYGDFMASMVEMIIERHMFGAEDLDRLLFCFLSLNKADYHGIIFEVFSEICQTLFSE